MKNWKKYLLSLVATVLLWAAMSPAAAADVQPAMWFMDVVNVTQAPNGSVSHLGTMNLDVAGWTRGVPQDILAPFDCKIVKLYSTDDEKYAHTVIVESLNPVLYADGSVDYMSMSFAHDDDVSDLWTGQTFTQGQVLCQTGKFGPATNVHSHVSCIRGKYKGDIWVSQPPKGYSCSPNAIHPSQALFLPEGIHIIKTQGIEFQTYIGCKHKYEFNKTTKLAACHCGEVYYLPAPTHSEAFMDVVAVNKDSNSAPVHNEPYGDSEIPDDFRYHLGDTVYVTGYLKNAFGNTWYQLSGGEWITGDYLGAHSHRYNSSGYCTRCLDKLSIMFMYMYSEPITYSAKKGSVIHYAPYGDSAKLPITCGNSVTVNGKIVNSYGHIWYSVTEGGWVYGEYLSGKKGYKTNANLFSGPLDLYNAPGGGQKLATIPAGADIYVYETEEIGDWYSVFAYDDTGKFQVGFVHKSGIEISDDYKAVELPSNPIEPMPPTPDGEDPQPPSGGDQPSTPSTPSGPTTVSLSYPTDPTYTGKITVGETNATVVSHIAKPAGTHVSACGLRLYDASWNLIKDHYEPLSNVGNSLTSFHAWYDIQAELGITLTPASTYHYQFYTVVDGSTYSGEALSFTTAGARVFYPTDPTYAGMFALSETNATVVAGISKPAGSRASACGLRLYDASWNLIKDHYEALNFIKDSATTFHAWYDIQAELGITLTPGTTYYYQFYAVVNGGTYSGEALSFTTTGNTPHTHTYNAVVTEPTCIEDGYTTYTCTCGESYTDDRISALGHRYNDEQDTSCNLCGEEREVILPDAPAEKPTVSGTVSGGASGATVEIGGTKIEVNDDGSFSIPAVGEIFDVVIRIPGALSCTVKNVSAANGDITLPTAKVVKGDTNGDDMINIMDMAAFRKNFGKTGTAVQNAYTDTNGDGMVNIMDMGTFRQNFGKTAAKDCTVEFS